MSSKHDKLRVIKRAKDSSELAFKIELFSMAKPIDAEPNFDFKIF